MNTVLIDSSFKTSGSSHNFELQFASFVPPLSGWYKLKSLVMPLTFYNIASPNNKIYFNENSTNKTATISSGTYDFVTICTAVRTALDNASGGFATFTVTYSDTTNKLTISSTQNFSILHATNTSSSSGVSLGFTTDTSAGTSQTGDSVLQLNIVQNLCFSINGFGGTFNPSNQQNSTFIIQCDEAAGSIFRYNSSEDYAVFIEFPTPANRIAVQIRDPSGSLIDLNGGNWSMLLEKQ